MTAKQKYYLNELRKIASKHGGDCLSDDYVNNRTYLQFKCAQGHIWKAKGNKIQQGQWCPYCAGRHKGLDYVRDIAKQHNGRVLDDQYLGTKHKYSWVCEKGHHWKSKLANVIHLNRWCPYCSGNAKDTIEHMQLLANKKNGECLSDTYLGHGSHLLWKCSCGYKWKCTPKNIKKGRWCPKCAGRLLPSIEEIQALAVARGGILLSSHIRRSSDHLAWQCERGHTWKASWNNVKTKNSWCPYCLVYYHEEKCREILEDIFKLPFPKNNKVLGCRLELDGYCEDLKLAFEYNGKQHYEFVPFWHRTSNALDRQKSRDARKARICEEMGIRLIIIPYTENDRLEKCIEKSLYNNACL